MPAPRLVIFLVSLMAILVFTLWLLDSLSRISGLLSAYPYLGVVLLTVAIALVLTLIGLLVWYLVILPKRTDRRRRKAEAQRPIAPTDKTEAAERNLEAVRLQVAQIQDEISRQELIARSRLIEENLAKGELSIVVFGTGSAGKTSLVNALMGRMVGPVGAAMGTTTIGETYRLQMKGIEREIFITDTPGILEAGIAGTEREALAKGLAADADLLLFIVDNDIRQSEFGPLEMLARIGKRSILVFNKYDQYMELDQDLILKSLRDRVAGLIPSTDVIRVSANPTPVILDTGVRVIPDPDVMPLIRHVAAVLRSEGEDLLADNILLQSQRLGDEARKLLEQQRRREAEKIVDRFQWIGAGVVAVTPVPVVDLLATAAVNAQMVVELGKVYGCEINSDRGRELAMSLAKTLVSLGVVKGAVSLVAAVLQVSVVGLLVGRAIQGISAAYLTRIAGRSFMEYFQRDQTWGDGGMAEVIQQQFQLNRRDEFVRLFVQDAIDRIVRPFKLEEELKESPFMHPPSPKSGEARAE
jgi:uncharacterized protein